MGRLHGSARRNGPPRRCLPPFLWGAPGNTDCRSTAVHVHDEQTLQARCGGLAHSNEGLIEQRPREGCHRSVAGPPPPAAQSHFACGDKMGLNRRITPVRHRVLKVSGSELKSMAQPLSGFGALGQ